MGDEPPSRFGYTGIKTLIINDGLQLAVLDTVLWPPVGSVIEFGNPNRDGVVTDVRLQLPQLEQIGSGGAAIFVFVQLGETISRSVGDRILRDQ